MKTAWRSSGGSPEVGGPAGRVEFRRWQRRPRGHSGISSWRGVGAVRGPRRAKNGDHMVRPGKEAAAVGRRRVLEHGAVPGRLPLFQKGRWQR